MTSTNYRRRAVFLSRLDKTAAYHVPALLAKGVISVPSIRQLPPECLDETIEAFMHCAIVKGNVLPMYELARDLHNESLLNRCIQFINLTFPGLRSIIGDEQLRATLGDSFFDSLAQEQEHTLLERQRLSKGHVQLNVWPEHAIPNPDGTIPYELLSLRLNEWPDFINPLQRERYLSTAEFRRVFRLTPEQFYQLPQWKQQRLKAAVHLF